MDTMTMKGDEIIFRSKLPDIYIPKHLPLHSYIFENISEFNSRPCLIDGGSGKVYSYEEVELTSRKVASGLSRHGIKQGDTVMLLLPNSPEFVFVFLGASYIGAISTTANPFFTPAEAIKQAASSAAKIIITMACYVEKVKDYAAEREIKIICIDSPPPGCVDFSEISSADENELPAVKIHPDDVVALLYSSGTSGLPKGVMLTHKSVVTGVAQQVDGDNPNIFLHTEDVMLCVLPLFHVFALNAVLLFGLRRGAAILLVHKFEMIAFLELIQKYKVTFGPFVPPMVLAIDKSPIVNEYDLSSVRIVLSGAAPLGKELENSIRHKFPNAKIGQGYGMTEAGPVLAMSLGFAKEPMEIKSGACGTVVRNAEMKIVDVETGASLGRNQTGEICIRGDQIMKEGLNQILVRAKQCGLISGVKLGRSGNSLEVTHMQYADDIVLMGEWSTKNICHFFMALEWFFMVSGLEINVNKTSIIGVGVPEGEIMRMANAMGCKGANLPFLYLGVPVGQNMANIKSWDSVVEAMKKRMRNWKSKLLSIGGRLTLCKSVLSSLPLYHFSLFRAPKKVIVKLESIRKDIFWGLHDDGRRKMTWISWDKILCPWENGGLNVVSLEAHNLGLLSKWWWRFKSNIPALWKDVIGAIHGIGGGLYGETPLRCSVWSEIRRIRNNIMKKTGTEDIRYWFGYKLKNGKNAPIWESLWDPICADTWSNEFPEIYKKIKRKLMTGK